MAWGRLWTACMIKCFHSLANVKFFVFILATLVTLQQGLSSGYTNSVITTIESRFEISSRFMGMVVSANDMGNVLTVMFVSYLGAKRHKPKWIAIGVLIMVLGCLTFTLPEFLTANTHVQDFGKRSPEKADTLSNKICHRNLTEGVQHGCSTEEAGNDHRESGVKAVERFNHPKLIFILAQFLIGCGGSPFFTLGITYIDDHVPPESSSLYIGTVYAMAAFGPVLGFLTGAYFLSVPSGSTAPDGKFLGLWWAGYLIAAKLLFLISLPFLAFPVLATNKEMLEERESESRRETEESIYRVAINGEDIELLPIITDLGERERLQVVGDGKSLKLMPKFIWRLISNPTYIITVLGGCMEISIVSGFVVFLSKYMETQFHLGKSETSLFVGAIAIPGACVGILTGGYLMKRLNLSPSGAAKFVLATNLICLAGQGVFFFLGCPNPNLAGVSVPYPNDNPNDCFELNKSCNKGCSCDNSLDPQLVCFEGTTFFSPCHAGCSINMAQCSCAGGGNVTLGPCLDTLAPCNKLFVPFMILLFFLTATVAATQMPLLMMVLRSVSPEDRSFALGVQFVFFRVLGYIPSPIIIGSVIDSSCMLWKVARCSSTMIENENNGRCLLYDIEDFRYKYVGVLSAIKCCSFCLFVCDYCILRKREECEKKMAITTAGCIGQDAIPSETDFAVDLLPNGTFASTLTQDTCQYI